MDTSRFCAFENDLSVPLYVDTLKEEKPEPTLWQMILLRLAAPFINMGVMAVIVILGSILFLVAITFWTLLNLTIGSLWAKLSKRLKKQLTNLGL